MKFNKEIPKSVTYIGGVLILSILVIALVWGCTINKKFTRDELNKKLIVLTKNYYLENSNALPKENNSATVSAQYFIDNKEIRNLTIKSGDECSGEIIVTNNNGYFMYTPRLTCGAEMPLTLTQKILTDQKIVTTGNGIYKYNGSYLFRGELLNNYISFAKKTWQIIKINEDGTIRIVDNGKRDASSWDDRYNIERETDSGINDFVANNVNSRIKDRLNEIYLSDEEFTDDERAHFVKHDLCVGKRNALETINDGSVECSVVIENQIFGLLQINEFLLASLDVNCMTIENSSCVNYNYLDSFTGSSWTLTADAENSHKVYKIYSGIRSINASSSGGVKIVAHLDENVMYSSGNGSLETPYIIN